MRTGHNTGDNNVPVAPLIRSEEHVDSVSEPVNHGSVTE